MSETKYRLGIDIGSTTVKVALIDNDLKVLFSEALCQHTGNSCEPSPRCNKGLWKCRSLRYDNRLRRAYSLQTP